MLDRLTVEDFSGHLGEPFRASCGDHPEALTLVQATASRIEPVAGGRRGFSLIFRGENRTVWLPQGIHALEHRDFPGLALFLTCLGPEAQGDFRYEAVFT